MVMGSTTCIEATLDGGAPGASLLQQQSHTQKSMLGASDKSESSALSNIGREARPSLSLLQAFSAGSGIASFAQKTGAGASPVEQPSVSLLQTGSGYESDSASQAKPPRRQQTVMMSLLHGQERGSLRSRLFWLAPMGVSLIACCIILSLVYVVTSGEPEDVQISRILGRIRDKQANKEKLNVAAFSGAPPITASQGIASMAAADIDSPASPTQPEVPAQAATDDSGEKEEQLARDEPARKEAPKAAAAEVKSDAAVAQSEVEEEVEGEAGESDASSDADSAGESDLR